MREIILPPHLYDRIKASAGEHGGIGYGELFLGIGVMWDRCSATPVCVHGHAWGTKGRFFAQVDVVGGSVINEPELKRYLSWGANDGALHRVGVKPGERIPFARWSEILNVKRGPEPVAPAVKVTQQVEALV